MNISRRRFLQSIFMLALVTVSAAKESAKNKYLLFVGTYTEKESKGIYAYRFDAASSELTSLGVAAETMNPSFLAIGPTNRFLYAVNEVQVYKGASTGAVSAFTIDPKNGKLSLLSQVASQGADPCYITLDKAGKYVLVANYTGGTAAVFPVQSDGHIGEASAVMHDSGTLGPNKERQDAPHAHWIEATPSNQHVYVSDLGLDRVLIYAFDATKGTLSKDGPDTGNFFSDSRAPGTGPRHAAFSADGNFMYVLGELDSAVTVFAHSQHETFRSVQHISALPAGFSGRNDAAEIAIHPNGKFLYTSNRGHDSITLFSIDPLTGALNAVDHFPTQGKTPRNFEIDPTGKLLFVANQDSDNIAVFKIDLNSGKLTFSGQTLHVPSPVCLKFVAVK